ncbi:MAG TPA: trehalase family glycosidase [Terriglobales bacterium]|nr:trehalase family glycosidase [Terriglobales bacterium]
MLKVAGVSRFVHNSALVVGLLATACVAQPASGGATLDRTQVAAIHAHISSEWDVLTRSMTDCKTVTDPKMSSASVLYLPAEYSVPSAVEKAQQDCHIQLKKLPAQIHGPGEVDTTKFDPHGLLYLENSYVVPGGSFNEMYGWDSYFIIRGLVSDGRVALARGMVDNFFFEIEHYGTILNANRTYYLTRAQPPFLTAMVMSVYEAEKAAGKADNAWLAKAYGYANKDYAMWTRALHLAGNTGLSRFYDFGNGLTPESLVDEEGVQRSAVAYFMAHPREARGYVAPLKADENGSTYDPAFTVEVCDTPSSASRPKCEAKTTLHMTEEYWHGDRAMRESGYDISFRFGPYGAGTHHFAPVCLNSLLYKTEKDMEAMARILGRTQEAKQWSERAATRAAIMRKLFWDAARGQFFDYDFEAGKRSDYESAVTFYPLWTGWATPEQARAVQKRIGVFERAGGLVASTRESGVQWDFPYGWAPQQLIAVEGLRNYKMDADADRISIKFLSTIIDDYKRVGTILEKYNMVTRLSDVTVSAGYQYNADGFGWTNGVFLVLLEKLPK